MRQESVVLKDDIMEKNSNLYVEAQCAFKECHQVLRELVKELLVFMLTDKDRKHDKNIPYSYPVAYAMKGNSMSNKNLRHLVNQVRTKLMEHEIPVLCEVYDGQWHKHIVKSDSESRRLTKLYGREIWNKYSSYSKDKCLEELNSYSILKKSSQKLISEMNCTHVSSTKIEIVKGAHNEIFVGTLKQNMAHIHSVHPFSRPDLYDKVEVIDPNNLSDIDFVVTEEKYRRESDGSKRKRIRKYKFVSKFTNIALEKNGTEKRMKWSKKLVGLINNE